MTSMPDFDIKDAIATRQFDLKDCREVHAYFWKPVYYPPVPEEGTYEYYECYYQIIGLGYEAIRYAGGVDSVQALMLAFQMVATHLYYSEAYKSGDLTYLGGRNLSLSLSDGMRADRQGYEKADLLSMPGYTTIIQLPDQRFASVVFEGGYLKGLSQQLKEISKVLGERDELAREKLGSIASGLTSILKHYEAVSDRAGLHLPYVKDEGSVD